MKNFYRLLIVVAVIALTVKSAVAQNVGIGTATPAQKLEIAGSTNTMRINGLAVAGTFIKTPTASTDKILFVNAAGDIQAILPGSTGAILTLGATGIPTWSTSATSATAWQLTGNGGTIPGVGVGNNYIGTTDAKDFVFGTAATERMRIGSTGLVGINTAPVAGQQVTVASSTLGNTALVGTSTAVYGATGQFGVTGLATGGSISNYTVTVSTPYSVNAGVFGSAGRGNGTSTLGFGVVGLLGTSLPNSSAFPAGAGVLGATKTGGTAPFAAGVAAFSSGGGYGVYSNVTGGGYGLYSATTGGGVGLYTSETGASSLIPGSNGNFGVYVLGNKNTVSGVYAYMGSKGVATVPTVASAVYATSDSTLGNVWALVANNTKSTSSPTGNGLLVYGTTNEIGTVILGQNTTTYMTGGIAANGQLVFDNAINTNTVTINTGVTTANYTLTLPIAQAASAGQVLTNDGTGVLTWSTPVSGTLSTLSNGTGISTLSYNGTAPATVGIANTGVSANSYGDAGNYPTFTVNAQGQLTVAGTQALPTTLPPSGAAGGDLTGSYPNPIINDLQGIGVLASGANAPTSGQVLEYNGSNWVPGTPAAAGVTSVSATLPLSVTNPATTPNILLSGTAGAILYGTGGGSAFTSAGTTGQVLQSNGSGVPTWTSSVAGNWSITGNSGTTAGTNFIGTTDATDFVVKTGAAGGTERMRVGGTATDAGLIGINAAPVAGQQLTVTTAGTGSTAPAAVVGSNTLVIAAGSANGSAGIVGLANGGLTTFKDSSTLNMSIGVYGSSGPGSYIRNTGAGFVGVGVLGLVGGASTTFPNSQPLPSAAGVVGASNNGGVGVVGMTSKGGTGVYATTASTNGQVAPLPVSGYGVFAVGSSKSENAIYGFMGSGEDQFPLTTVPEIGASIYATTNLTGLNANTNLPSYALAAVNNSSLLAPTGNGLFVYGTTNEIGAVTLGQNTTTYMTGGVAANGQLVFDNASNTNTVTVNTGVTTGSYSLTLPTAQATSGGQVLTNDGTGVLTWASAGGSSVLSNGTGISTLSYNGTAPATVSIANTGVTAGTYGSDTTVPVYNVNAQGQITSVSNVRISSGALTGTAGGDLSGSYPAPTVVALQGVGVSATAPSLNQVLLYDGSEWIAGNPSGSGTVTSVGLALPSIFNVTGSPVTGAGTLTGTLSNQNANLVFAGPVSGGAGAPTFRSLVAADLPAGAGNYIQNQNSAAQAANFYISGNASIGTAPVIGQQLTVSSSAIGTTALVGTNTATYNANTNGIFGTSGVITGGGSANSNNSVNTGATFSVNTGVFGSAGRGNGTTTLGFGVTGLLGTSLPTSSPYLAGAGVLGATKTGGTAPFAAGVAAYSSGGGYGLYSSVTGGGYGLYNTTTGGGYGIYSSSTGGAFGLYESVTGSAALTSVTGAVPLGSGNFGVFVNGNSNSLAGVYSYVGSKGIVTAPTTVSGVYATTDSSTARVWALTANNTKFASPTGNGLLVYGTSNSVGALTLGQNTTTYMTGGTAANGQLVFDNAINTNTVTFNTGVTTGSYSLTLPTTQATSPGQVLTNDGTGILTWSSAGGGSVLSNGIGINTFSYNGSAPATVSIANTGVTAANYGDASNYPTFTVNAQGQLTAVGTQALPTTLPPSGAAGGDLTGIYPNPIINELQGIGVLASGANAPTNGQVLEYNGTNWVAATPAVAGVTSVGLAMPSIFSVSGSPITTSGTLTATLANETANTVFAGPASGGAGAPTFRTLVAADVPAASGNYIQNQNSAAQTANFYITGNAGIGIAPLTGQQLTVSSSSIGTTALVGTNTATYNANTNGIFGTSGVVTGGGSANSNNSVNTGATFSVNTGVFGSAGRGNGTTTLGFGVTGLLGTSLPTSSPYLAGAGVLGATKTGGTAPFAAGVAAYSSGGGYGLYSSVTGGGYGLYNTTTGGGYGIYSSSTGGAFGLYESVTGAATLTSVTGAVPLGSGNFGVFVNGNSNSLSGVYSYVGSKGIVTAPTTISGVYATTDSSTARVWALTANNTKFATPTGNGLLVYGTSNSVGALTLGQNTTTYMTGGTAANGQLVFDNEINTNTVTLNTGVTSVNYSLTLPTAQATASGQVLTNDGTGLLSWTSPAGSEVTSVSGTAPIVITNPTTTPNVSLTTNTISQASGSSVVVTNGANAIVGSNPVTVDVVGAAGEIYYGTGSSAAFTTGGASGQVLQYNASGVPTWSIPSTSGTAWQLTGNANTTAGTNFIGTTDATDFEVKTNSALRMTIGGTVANAGLIGINTAPVSGQQLTSSIGTTANSGLVGINTIAAGTGNSGYGTAGIGSGGAITYQAVIASGPTLNINAGLFGSAAIGPVVPASGTSNVGFGVVGMLGTTLPTSASLPSGAGVLGTATSGGTAVAAYASGNGVGVLANASGGGTGVQSTASGDAGSGHGGTGVQGTASSGGTGLYGTSSGSNTQVSPLPTGGYGVFATGTSNSEAAVYGYLGSGAGTPSGTVPNAIAGVYGSTNLNGATNWAMVANNTKNATPTANGLLVFGTTNAVGTLTLGANSTGYFTSGGVTANGSLIFDNSTNTNTVTLNTGVTSANYSLTLPTTQASSAGQVLTNDGTGILSWSSPASGTVTSVSAIAPLSITNPTTTPGILLSGSTGGILYGTGSGSAFSTAGTSGQLLQSTGASAPTWVNVSSVIANAWNLAGNSGTTAGTNFVGTSDPQDLVFKTDGNEDMRIANGTGYIGIGTNNPIQPLTVSQAADATKYVVSSSATQLTLVGHYQNVALYGYAKGGNNSHGFAVGAMGIADPGSEGGAAIYGAFNTTAPTLTLNNFYGVYVDASTTGPLPTYAAAFMNGNVGIGTVTPAQALDIVGNVSFSQALMPGGNPGVSGQVLQSHGGGAAPTWVNADTGTVTSVGLSVPASSIFGVTGSPITSSGTLGITTTGISGGIPYFSSASTISSSALLTHYGILLGGGSGGAPTSTAALANGQVLIGSTGAAPVPDTIAVAANSGISITNGAGTITLATNGVLNNIKLITGSTTSYTPTAGTKAIQVELIGGGGGGGSTTSPGSNGSAGGGGGSGGYIKFMISNPTGTYTVAVGASGAGGSGGSNGSAGGATTFTAGATYSAGGGGGGIEGNANYGVPGGAGGTNSGGALISVSGNPGGNSWNGNTSAACSGVGGSSVLGGGGAAVNLIATGGPTTGTAGATNSGAGGSGGATVGHSAATGGAGAAGVIIITEYK